MFRFFLQAGPMAKFILALLVLFSLGSWAVIFGKMVQFRRADQQSEKFLEAFHRSQRFSEVNALAEQAQRLAPGGHLPGRLRRDRQPDQERPGAGAARREAGLPHHLAARPGADAWRGRSTSSSRGSRAGWASSPPPPRPRRSSAFSARCGASWQAFNDIGLQGSTSIVAVAPGIAEALINTAAGLGRGHPGPDRLQLLRPAHPPAADAHGGLRPRVPQPGGAKLHLSGRSRARAKGEETMAFDLGSGGDDDDRCWPTSTSPRWWT